MTKRSSLQRFMTLSASVVWGASELVALQRAYVLNRIVRIKSSLAGNLLLPR